MTWKTILGGLAATAVLGTAMTSYADDPVRPATGTTSTPVADTTADAAAPARKGVKLRDDSTGTTTAIRASELQGMTVLDNKNETIGSVSDLVIDPTSGKVKYAAVSVGGFLGLGDKMFAVPWDAFSSTTYEGYQYLKLDTDREIFTKAPAGFDQDKWPDMADKNLEQELKAHYQDLMKAQRNEEQAEQKAERIREQSEKAADAKEAEADRIRDRAENKADRTEEQADKNLERTKNEAQKDLRDRESK